MRVYTVLLAAALTEVSLCAQIVDMTKPTNNPTYSEALLQNKDPHAHLEQQTAELNSPQSGLSDHFVAARLAKLALEAGENQLAHDYAVSALKLADADAAKWAKHGIFPNPRVVCAHADYYANMVLGRLALLNGDLRSAEQYLLASGGAQTSFLLPNLSLASELLKHGDLQTRLVVLQFIEKIKTFWPIPPKNFQQWEADITAGKMPNFQSNGPAFFN